MRKNLKSIAALAGMLVFLLASAVTIPLSGCTAPAPSVSGEASAEGGDDSLGSNVNLRDVSIQQQSDTTLVQLSFVNGSRYSGVEESKISSVPGYEITELSDPARICVALAIGFADFAQEGTVFQDSLVNGIFDCDIAGKPMKQLYLQLSGPADLECEADGSTLTLRLTPRTAQNKTAWYVGLNAVAQYMNGLVPEDLGFTPSLCDDYANVILLSEPLSGESAAQKKMEEASAALPSSIPQSAMYTFEMDVNMLPPYQNITGADIAASVAVMQVNGEEKTLPVFLDNGRYLATGPDGTVLYAVPYLPEYDQDTEHLVKEELWEKHVDGSQTQIGTGDFYDIREAAYSSDGRYLGILDAQAVDQVLYVYDTASGTLLNLGEEGLGNGTASFVWDPNKNTIYAMSGNDGALQLLKYDFDAPEGAQRVSSVEERNGSDSDIAFANGRIYFADQASQMICSVDVSGGQRTQLAPGVSLRISGNGRYLAVLVPRPVDEEEVNYDLVLLDAESGVQLATVIGGVRVEDFMFGSDLDTLYFTTQNYEGTSVDYPFAILRYSISDGATELVGYSRSEIIANGPAPETLYIVYYFTGGDTTKSMLPVTYVFEEQTA